MAKEKPRARRLTSKTVPRLLKAARRNKLVSVLRIIATVAVLTYICLLGASYVFVSGGLAYDMLGGADDHFLWHSIRSLGLPGLNKPGPLLVERVDIAHALWNAVFIFCTVVLLCLLPLLCILVGLILTPLGLVTANWEVFGTGLLIGLLGTPLFVIIALLTPLFLWFGLLIQPCTPAYALAWLVVGLPFMLLGAFVGSAPTATVIVIVKQ